jgi:hypothetical protein
VVTIGDPAPMIELPELFLAALIDALAAASASSRTRSSASSSRLPSVTNAGLTLAMYTCSGLPTQVDGGWWRVQGQIRQPCRQCRNY